MLTAFIQHKDGRTVLSADVETFSEQWTDDGVVLWLDLAHPDDNEIEVAGRVLGLPLDYFARSLSAHRLTAIEEMDTHLSMALHAVWRDTNSGALQTSRMAALLNKRVLVTIHAEEPPAIVSLRERCTRHKGRLLSRGADGLFCTLADAVVAGYALAAEELDPQIERLELASLMPQVDRSLLSRASRIKRELFRLRRGLTDLREILDPLTRGEFDVITESAEGRTRHVLSHIMTSLELVDGLRSLTSGVRDNYDSALANRLNSIMTTLTLFSSIILPLTLISGIYGMNVPLWPNPENPVTFWGLMGIMGTTGGGLYLYFRFRRWL